MSQTIGQALSFQQPATPSLMSQTNSMVFWHADNHELLQDLQNRAQVHFPSHEETIVEFNKAIIHVYSDAPIKVLVEATPQAACAHAGFVVWERHVFGSSNCKKCYPLPCKRRECDSCHRSPTAYIYECECGAILCSSCRPESKKYREHRRTEELKKQQASLRALWSSPDGESIWKQQQTSQCLRFLGAGGFQTILAAQVGVLKKVSSRLRCSISISWLFFSQFCFSFRLNVLSSTARMFVSIFNQICRLMWLNLALESSWSTACLLSFLHSSLCLTELN
jgi:hypothetical protein